jgi:hypothetical protein
VRSSRRQRIESAGAGSPCSAAGAMASCAARSARRYRTRLNSLHLDAATTSVWLGSGLGSCAHRGAASVDGSAAVRDEARRESHSQRAGGGGGAARGRASATGAGGVVSLAEGSGPLRLALRPTRSWSCAGGGLRRGSSHAQRWTQLLVLLPRRLRGWRAAGRRAGRWLAGPQALWLGARRWLARRLYEQRRPLRRRSSTVRSLCCRHRP